MGALLALGFLTVVGGLTWAWFGGGPLAGSRGALVAFLVWPALGAVLMALGAVHERVISIRVRVPLPGVESLGDLLLIGSALALTLAFTGAVVWAVLHLAISR